MEIYIGIIISKDFMGYVSFVVNIIEKIIWILGLLLSIIF